MTSEITTSSSNDAQLIKSFENNIDILEKKIDEAIENMRQLELKNSDISMLEERIDRLNKAGSILLEQFEGELKRIRANKNL